MPECKDCKYAIWDEVEYYPHARVCYVDGCELDNDSENCEDFEECEEDDER